MIKNTELRIGNILQDRKGRICKVNTIGEDYFQASAIKGPMTSLPCSGIPLTPEKLIKLGARGIELWLPVANLNCELHFECYESGEIVTTLKGQFADLILDRIYFVHQIQNLYFALTGTELIYKG